ncbi:hypothetical protein K2173_019562 [Erythroxylum novogranatense]|uniref:Dof zinc finger protein n=1 Tax=Erythroxylum novogranatense TaxID=1862640 RepID=A0AAV8UCW6_9ROSI|nr:hypothetical protein K2173_019562 [Erythroxylum novogranatense]
MVFSSIPPYLDPANFQQQPNHHHIGGASTGSSSQLPPPQPPPPPQLPPLQPHGSGGVGSIRPGSMADRARMANIPMPEAALKCPRCESTNTKFCYFNNYSLSQPRHFCKTCRRYWTRGGALRSVPVGGGCRRNKRSKGSSSKSPVSSDRQTCSAGSTSTVSSNSGTSDILGLGPQLPPLRFMAPLHHLTDYATADMGLNYGGLSAPVGGSTDLNFQIGSALAGVGLGGSAGAGGSLLSVGGLDQWRLHHQQFPFLGGLDSSSSSGLYPFEGSIEQVQSYGGASQMRAKMSSSGATQLAPVKMEDNHELNLSRQFLGIHPGNDQYWSGSAWTDLSNFSSSSTSNQL